MDILLEAFRRNKSVKTKKLLAEGFVPGCFYGKGIGTVKLKIPQKNLTKIFQNHARKIDLKVEGKTWLVAVSEIQREAVSRKICHISFNNLDKNQESIFEVEIFLTGRPKEGMLDHMLHVVEVKGRPEQIPDRLEMDTGGLKIGDTLRISDLSKQYPLEIVSTSDIIAKCRHLQILEESRDELQEKPEKLDQSSDIPEAEVMEKVAS